MSAVRVLVVDDDDHIRAATARVLVRAGFDVVTADDGAPAIAQDGAFDLVLADFNMKTVDGVEVVRHYKARFGASVYCAILSGDESNHAAAIAAGADDVFVKPASPSVLRKRLTDVARALRPDL